MSIQESMWRGLPDRLALARDKAHAAHRDGKWLSAHSIMLSAYISVGVEKLRRMERLKMQWHFLVLYVFRNQLSHNQLNIMMEIMIELHRRYGWFKKGVTETSWRQIRLAEERGAPHELALAYVQNAAVASLRGDGERVVKEKVQRALMLEPEIRAEEDQPQGLRQFVRVLRKAGEILLKYDGETMYIALEHLRRARELAMGEADAPDQIEKIRRIISDWHAGRLR